MHLIESVLGYMQLKLMIEGLEDKYTLETLIPLSGLIFPGIIDDPAHLKEESIHQFLSVVLNQEI